MGGDTPTILAIEGGGTKTVALIATATGQIHRRLQFGPLNLKLATDTQILNVLRSLRRSHAPTLHAVSVCLAGCRTAADRARLRALAARVWPRAKIFVGNDLDSGHAAAFGPHADGLLVISGTGACVFGRHGSRTIKVGGWGHLLGDQGSGYWIAISNLQSQISNLDRTGRVAPPLQQVLRRLCLNSPEQLVDWIHRATKSEIAALTSELFDADRAIVAAAARHLAGNCRIAAHRLRLRHPAIALTGGVFAHHPAFARALQRQLPGYRFIRPAHESAVGALLLAGIPAVSETSSFFLLPSSFPVPLTEQRNPRTLDLDRQSIPQLIDTMLAEESRVIPALRANKSTIARAIRAIVAAFRRGGRLFYVGAGTSGRLGVLDASECPPTFSADPAMVQGIIAGGVTALHSPVEAGEDDAGAGADAIRSRGVSRRDVVVGIAASGTTPFVHGALDAAKKRGAKTFLLCFSAPRSTLHAPLRFETGPEVLTGSTRLKAGTATKLVLNLLTTISMIRLGKVISNLMVDVKPTNTKLRARACRIVAALRDCSETEARARLARARWNVKRALRR
jgi:N-acetylmuramic acid 6-phosphate etherase